MSASATQGGHKKKPQDENIMAGPIPQGGHKKRYRGLNCVESGAKSQPSVPVRGICQ